MKFLIGIDEVGRAASKRRASPNRYLIGIDEVGRGSLAGPVTVVATAIPVGLKFKNLKDSKKLSAKQREDWFAWIKKHPKISYIRSSAYPKIIDRINISKAANRAATRAVLKLIESQNLSMGKVKILLDGGLYINKNSKTKNIKYQTIIKGDQKFSAIKIASIIAKVNRDRIMDRNHSKYPTYGFREHKGYGTRQHIRAVKKHGPIELHRLTFVKNFYKV